MRTRAPLQQTLEADVGGETTPERCAFALTVQRTSFPTDHEQLRRRHTTGKPFFMHRTRHQQLCAPALAQPWSQKKTLSSSTCQIATARPSASLRPAALLINVRRLVHLRKRESMCVQRGARTPQTCYATLPSAAITAHMIWNVDFGAQSLSQRSQRAGFCSNAQEKVTTSSKHVDVSGGVFTLLDVCTVSHKCARKEVHGR